MPTHGLSHEDASAPWEPDGGAGPANDDGPERPWGDSLFRAGRLKQELMIDLAVMMENERLDYIRYHQHDMRASKYRILVSAGLSALLWSVRAASTLGRLSLWLALWP